MCMSGERGRLLECRLHNKSLEVDNVYDVSPVVLCGRLHREKRGVRRAVPDPQSQYAARRPLLFLSGEHFVQSVLHEHFQFNSLPLHLWQFEKTHCLLTHHCVNI